jgi:predicted regulator of Ras-like GTPase activity (Roadblock/LC7/MglB family)
VTLSAALDELTRQPGVRGALVVSAVDGLVVADALMEDVDGGAVAALTSSLLRRMRGVAVLLGQTAPQLVHLVGAEGSLLAAPAGEDLLVVAVARPEVNVGAVRLALRRAAERVS